MDWLKCLDYGFERSSCIKCINHEIDELENGKPFCELEGKCKHFANIKSQNMPNGNPNELLSCNDIFQFDEFSDKIIGLSSWDSSELPSVDFYSNMAGEVSMSEELFQDLLLIKLNHIKHNIIDERKKRNQHGS